MSRVTPGFQQGEVSSEQNSSLNYANGDGTHVNIELQPDRRF